MSTSSDQSTTYHKPDSIEEAWSNPYYKGKIVVECGDEFFSTTSGERAVKKIQQLKKKYPDQKVRSTVIPPKGIMVSLPLREA